MELETTDGDTLMSVSKMRPDKSRLVIEGQIMDAIPVRAILTPQQARAALKLIDFKTFVFLLTILFRR